MRIKRKLMDRIANRDYTEEKPVPPERVLAKELRAALMTVRRAIQELVAGGVTVAALTMTVHPDLSVPACLLLPETDAHPGTAAMAIHGHNVRTGARRTS